LTQTLPQLPSCIQSSDNQAVFSGDTDGFDVFDEDNREDFSHLASSTDTSSQHPSVPTLSAIGKLTDRQVREMEIHMQEPDEDIIMDTDNQANDIAPTITDTFEQDLQHKVAYAPGLMAATEGENVILSHQVPIVSLPMWQMYGRRFEQRS
jgi:hypothetical protein